MASRSVWKLFPLHPMFFSKNFLARKSIKLVSRSLHLPFLPGERSFYIYNGQKYMQVIYKREMAGFKLGSFASTKVLGYQPKTSKKKRN